MSFAYYERLAKSRLALQKWLLDTKHGERMGHVVHATLSYYVHGKCKDLDIVYTIRDGFSEKDKPLHNLDVWHIQEFYDAKQRAATQDFISTCVQNQYFHARGF